MSCASACRSCFETVTKPIAKCCRYICGMERCDHLPEWGPIGTREETLVALATCARLVYGTGFIDEETWGKFDPPLNGEGWKAVDQICETRGSPTLIQAACYVWDNGEPVSVLDSAASRELRTTTTTGWNSTFNSVFHPFNTGRCGYTPAKAPSHHNREGVGIIAFRGTVSFKGVLQDLALWSPITGSAIRKAVKEASSYYLKCRDLYPEKHLYVTGHSLGGYIAEAVASYNDVEGAVFNSPGPWSPSRVSNVTGRYRPEFEIHLTRSDPLALSFFPKPENSAHIGKPTWHPGKNHRVCQPYMREVSDMQGVAPNDLPFDERTMVDQVEALEDLYPPPESIDVSESDENSDDPYE